MSEGDANFHKKAQAKIQEFFKSGKTIIIVSHWLEYIKQNCERVLEMRLGKLSP
ncbi:MAG: ABC transporter related protein [Candidatus Gottesmanbacteria bacterium GW2011_GWA1_43_11]|uniref:ABC transporter related protein n=1 Tax=Candidatus Gottesmanbacteria bacterium GW2011_GWA1_43_11 TaxID=1618436 RepID=A0A0G1CB95_9BACT|nr:MAG: ABC transporter related protein [Candidatus Gottesmanbacteria bacterium GW2011_GWA1_43_11]